MISNRIEPRVFLEDYARLISVYLGTAENENGQRGFVENLEIRTVDEGHIYRPTFRIDKKSAQVLMDDLWKCGLRPTDGKGSAGQLTATERHLDDMRRLVGTAYEVEF